ncbi:uncharacterized protein [Nicotiana tomentosiformis]|uniref:uncharacterized protein n=1 Tax=Nicotiana tomentosiformis TaxID=4098 RepID=UPI00388C5034
MHDFIMAEESELWDMICDGSFVPMKIVGEGIRTVPKTRKEYNDADRKSVEKNFKANKILIFGIRTDEYNRVSTCESIHTRFTCIINELHSLGEIIPPNNLVRKILSVLPGPWESNVNAITEAKDCKN